MCAALRKYFPTSVHGTTPQGGLFLGVPLPESLETTVSLQAAIAETVVFVPGVSFFADGSGHHTFRLNVSNATPAKIEQGSQRLGSVLERALAPRAAVAELHSDHVEHRGTCFPMASGRTVVSLIRPSGAVKPTHGALPGTR